MRRLRRDDRRTRDSCEVHEVRWSAAGAGIGCARYLVLLGVAAVHDLGMARGDARSGGVLSHVALDHRLRHSLLLGIADDHDGLLVHDASASSAWPGVG